MMNYEKNMQDLAFTLHESVKMNNSRPVGFILKHGPDAPPRAEDI